MACRFKTVIDGFMWGFGGMYGPNEDGNRKEHLDEFVSMGSWWNLPRCIGSDYNITRFPS